MGKPLTDELIFNMTDEQRLALHELAEMATEEFKLSEEISEKTEALRRTHQAMGFKTSDSPKSLFEDPEIETLITVSCRYKFENLKEQIKRALVKAIELGLGDLEIIQRQAKLYDIPLSKLNK